MTFAVLRCVARMLYALGFAGIRILGEFVGALLWIFLRCRRKESIQRVRDRLEVPLDKARDIARASFTHNAKAFLEIVQNPRFGLGSLCLRDPAGIERLLRIIAIQRPLVIASAHFGAWELLAGLVKDSTRSIATVVRRQKNSAAHELICELRNEGGMASIDHREASSRVLAHLRGNGVVCFLVDHNCRRSEAIFLPFLGKSAAVNMGPALLALRGKALVCPVFLQREEKGGYSIRAEEPLDTALLEGSIADRVRHIAVFYTEAVERCVRARPEQWFWMHERWKTRPEGEI